MHILIESGRLVVMQKPRNEFNERPKMPTQRHKGRGRATMKTKHEKNQDRRERVTQRETRLGKASAIIQHSGCPQTHKQGERETRGVEWKEQARQ